MASERPLIAVTGPRHGARGAWLFTRWAIFLAGGRAVRLSPDSSESAELYHGIVIGGGDDIDPVLYAEASELEAHFDTERDAFESIMIEEALAAGLPLLGICRGAQLLNVRLGGSLIQDLRVHRRNTSNRRTLLPLKTLFIERESMLYRLFETPRAKINSLHNQSIDRIGQGLRVVGRDLDDIVQAVEVPDRRFVMGVQWHPEYLPYLAPHMRLFKALVEAAAEHVRS